ncbi:MAG: hypothetical protein A7316_04000 [Candidatus Altiarchaeales archaeon WOR_SM1_86-2]|nr:MAG: hypothetical protein A7316_04000 [Candidatus Altiarchaeales archaeon WOR_SM1_86-2]ODS39155.1 MAG: hypothetical protein A7315_11470 [Candidatus Altiarchaeales archaeon WOR_SM1_79]
MMQIQRPENLNLAEERHEMILAHEKFGMKIRDIRDTYGVSTGTYYYWKNRYQEEGFIGLVGKKRGPQVPHNKTPEKFENKIVQIASDNRELDAKDTYDVMCERYGFTRTVRTVERILVKHNLNKPKGRRSKKNNEKENENNPVNENEITEVEQKPAEGNVYTNPKSNPQRNPNVDPKRTRPLTEEEKSVIKEAHEKYSELGSWNLPIILSNIYSVHYLI